ncbi:MAG: hypothetical protein IPK32_15320 [Verrucomicrobiaceae bacterium]|nr:hypothetical protein [Verrucomicrobiaceae bacterium]
MKRPTSTNSSRLPMQHPPQEMKKPQAKSIRNSSLRLSQLPSAASAALQSCGVVLSISLLPAFLFLLSAPLPAAEPPELILLRQQYDKIVAERVTAPFDAALALLNGKYTTALDAAIAEAKKAGNLAHVLAIEADKTAVAAKQPRQRPMRTIRPSP